MDAGTSREPDASAETVLAAYAPEIDALKARGGYVTADVIDVKPDTPNLDVMLAKFNREHWHDEDEVRFIIEGRGLFHVHLPERPVFAIEVEAGDLIRVPRGTHHWFDLCVRSAASARSDCFRTPRAGRRITPKVASTRVFSLFASVPRIFANRAV